MANRSSEQMLIHFYRGELARSDRWRTRLDTTTNWALTATAAVISISFSSSETSHTILIVGGFLVWTFLMVETRRYRYYDLWIRRVRLLEDGVVVPALRDEDPDPDALRELADLVSSPRLMVSSLDAMGLRLRRTYLSILAAIAGAWLLKISAHPRPAGSFAEFVERAHVGNVPGAVILAIGVAAATFTLWIYVRSFLRPVPRGELETRRRPRRPLAVLFGRVATRPRRLPRRPRERRASSPWRGPRAAARARARCRRCAPAP